MRQVFALIFVTIPSLSWAFLPDGLYARASWMVFSYIMACLLVLPMEICIFAATILGVSYLALAQINMIKISLTHMPLTFMDMSIAAHDPEGFLNAIHAGESVLLLAYSAAAFVAVAGAVLILRWIRRLSDSGLPLIEACTGAVVFSLSALLLLKFIWALNTQQQARIAQSTWWEPDVLAYSSERRFIPFLVASYFAEEANPISWLGKSTSSVPSTRENDDAINLYVRPRIGRDLKKPNIVVILAESTFNPNIAFKLSRPVEGAVVSISADTQAFGQLRVNAIGGGTWITEFETITGIDSRFFGYSGYYTHASVSPYIKRSIASYLTGYGYHTAAFYGVPGNFYNARSAYKKYGFENFFDSIELGYSGGDWRLTDARLIDTIVKKLGTRPSSPFFAYVVTIENHGPHNCSHFSKTEQLITTLVGSIDFDTNCQLNEYLLRLSSTDIALRKIEEYLKELKQRTGRPYVIIVFGDHQPHTFTFSGVSQRLYPAVYVDRYHDYSPYRTNVPVNETVFHIKSDIPGRITCCDKALPATLIPSLLSAFVAPTASDLYLGQNFYLYSQCGSNFFPEALSSGFHAEGSNPATVGPECRQAREKALATYRMDGIF